MPKLLKTDPGKYFLLTLICTKTDNYLWFVSLMKINELFGNYKTWHSHLYWKETKLDLHHKLRKEIQLRPFKGENMKIASHGSKFLQTCPVLKTEFEFAAVFPSREYYLNYIYCVANVLLTFTTTFLNGVTLVAYWRSSQLKRKTTYFLVMLLLLNDLGVGLLSNPTYTTLPPIKRNFWIWKLLLVCFCNNFIDLICYVVYDVICSELWKIFRYRLTHFPSSKSYQA